MPEIKHYLATQTRQVRVVANNEVDAVIIAQMAFENPDEHRVRAETFFGESRSRVNISKITIDRDGV